MLNENQRINATKGTEDPTYLPTFCDIKTGLDNYVNNQHIT
jgi:hypothetical protein